MADGNGQEYILAKSFKPPLIAIVFLIFTVQRVFCTDEDFLALFEKVELEELPPAEDYYVDDSPLNQLLKLFDEEDYERQKAFLEQKKRKIITDAGSIPVPQNKYTQEIIHDFIARYMTKAGKENLYRILDEGEVYRLYIREEIKRRRLPAALEYLPVVESEYKAKAKSRSGARGLWQFMENSMVPFLKKNTYLDERLDPWKSTNAALSKLEDNFRIFNDWTLAIGAYNCGAGAMSRALKKAPVKSFWYLAEHNMIPEETKFYVPKLLAITEIACHNEEYKVSLPHLTESKHYADFDYITTKSSISLERISSEIRLDHETLKKLNMELLLDRTPPFEYKLRLPAGLLEAAEQAVSEIEN